MISDTDNRQRVLLGHITAVSGLKGWVKVHSDTRPRENIVQFSGWWLQCHGQWKQFELTDGRPQGKTIVAHLAGINTPEQAAELIGATIAVDREALPETLEGEFYWADLTGMEVSTLDGIHIGPVIRLFETGANDVMVVRDCRESASSEREVLVPWLVPDVIRQVDTRSRVITVDWDPDF